MANGALGVDCVLMCDVGRSPAMAVHKIPKMDVLWGNTNVGTNGDEMAVDGHRLRVPIACPLRAVCNRLTRLPWLRGVAWAAELVQAAGCWFLLALAFNGDASYSARSKRSMGCLPLSLKRQAPHTG